MNDNLEERMDLATSAPSHKSWFKVTLKVLASIGAMLLLFALMLPAVRNPREAAARTVCKNNLKQIGLALHAYHDAYGSLPPAYTGDAEGNRLHSWRTLLLPYLGQSDLYSKIDLSKDWKDPANAEAYKTSISTYHCPNLTGPASETTYLAVVTQVSCFRPNEGVKLLQVTDGTSNTLGVIEVNPKQAVHWMAPWDADEQLVLRFASGDQESHLGGAHALLLDGSVRFIQSTTPAKTRLILISIAGNEPVPDF
jgi:hypothetical protein